MTYQEMLRRYAVIRDKADRVSRSISARSLATYRLAGVPDAMCGHNAMCGHSYGRPWAGVNYSLVRRARWIGEKSWQPNRVAQAAWSRLYDEWRNGGFQYDR